MNLRHAVSTLTISCICILPLAVTTGCTGPPRGIVENSMEASAPEDLAITESTAEGIAIELDDTFASRDFDAGSNSTQSPIEIDEGSNSTQSPIEIDEGSNTTQSPIEFDEPPISADNSNTTN